MHEYARHVALLAVPCTLYSWWRFRIPRDTIEPGGTCQGSRWPRFEVNGGPPRAVLSADDVGIPFPYGQTVGNAARLSSREQSLRRRECTLLPAMRERGYYQRETRTQGR